MPAQQAGEGEEGDIPLPQIFEGNTSDGDRAPSPACGRGTGVRAGPGDSPVPKMRYFPGYGPDDDDDDWYMTKGTTPGKVWDSRHDGFGAAARQAAAVVRTAIPGFDE